MIELPLWAAIVVSILVVGGALFTLLGTIGLLRLKSFYDRVHAPTMGTSMGMMLTSIGSMLYFSIAGGKPLVHEILIIVFVTITTPITLMLLARAGLYRDRAEGNPDVPPPPERSDALPQPDA